jgi:hypothetical protein
MRALGKSAVRSGKRFVRNVPQNPHYTKMDPAGE